jgi:hypothetical protein
MNESIPAKLLLKKWMIIYLFISLFIIIFWGSIATQENVSRVAADSDNVFFLVQFCDLAKVAVIHAKI